MQHNLSVAKDQTQPHLSHLEAKTAQLSELPGIVTNADWCPFTYRGDKRLSGEFRACNLLVYDVDDTTSLDEAIQALELLGTNYIVGTTKSHQKPKNNQPACDRFRVIIPLSTSIIDPGYYQKLWFEVSTMLEFQVDQHCKDLARYYYPCVEVIAAKVDRSYLDTITAVAEPKSSLLKNQYPAVSGEDGNAKTYQTACYLIHDLGLSEEKALAELKEYNKSCKPPWPVSDLERFILNAQSYGRGGNNKHANKLTDEQLLDLIKTHLDERFAVFTLKDGETILYSRESDRVFSPLKNDKKVASAAYHYIKAMTGTIPSQKKVQRAVELWAYEAKPIPKEPAAFKFKGEDLDSFAVIPFTPKAGPHEAWSEFLDRLSDPEAFKAFVWSCFEKKNESRQVMWLRGDGQNGKSVVLNVLAELFSDGYAALPDTSEKRFYYSNLYGKKVGMIADCKNHRIVMTSQIRNLSSGDPVNVEHKGGSSFTANIHLRIFIASNFEPEISSMTADKSRLIWVEVEPTKNNDDPGWADRLREQLPQFLFSCKEAFAKLCPKNGNITVNEATKELSAEAAQALEQRFVDIIDEAFEIDPEAQTSAKEVTDILSRYEVKAAQDIGKFKVVAFNRHGVKYHRGRNGRCYLGFKPKGLQIVNTTR